MHATDHAGEETVEKRQWKKNSRNKNNDERKDIREWYLLHSDSLQAIVFRFSQQK